MVLIMIIPSTAMTGDRVVDTALRGLGKISPIRGGGACVARARSGVVVAGLFADVGKLLVSTLAGGTGALAARLGVRHDLGARLGSAETLFGDWTVVNVAQVLFLGDSRAGLGKGVFVLVKPRLAVGVLHGESGLRVLRDTRVVGVEQCRIIAVVVKASADGFSLRAVEAPLADIGLVLEGVRLNVAEGGVREGVSAGVGRLVKLVSLVVALDITLVLRRQALLVGGGRVGLGEGARKMVLVNSSHCVGCVLSECRK